MLNYGFSGYHAVNYHYGQRFISTYCNKLLYNVVNPGIIGNYLDIKIKDFVDNQYIDSNSGKYIEIKNNLSIFIKPNNEFTDIQHIKNNYNNLSDINKKIISKQILKYDLLESIILPIENDKPNLICEYNWEETTNNTLKIFFSANTATNNQILLCELILNGEYVENISYNNQTISSLNSKIKYNMNVDKLNNYHCGNEANNISLSNEIINNNCNAELLNGYSGIYLALKNTNNNNLNANYIFYNNDKLSPGNETNNIPLSNKILNKNLNTNFLGGKTSNEISLKNHTHNYDNIVDGSTYKKLIGVNSNEKITNSSCNDYIFKKENLSNVSFIRQNDDFGGKLKIVSGLIKTNKNNYIVDFGSPFSSIPNLNIQLIDDNTGTYSNKYIKYKYIDISKNSFIFNYEIYSVDNNNVYQLQEYNLNEYINFFYVAIGYGS